MILTQRRTLGRAAAGVFYRSLSLPESITWRRRADRNWWEFAKVIAQEARQAPYGASCLEVQATDVHRQASFSDSYLVPDGELDGHLRELSVPCRIGKTNQPPISTVSN
jgi:hypothetical protein